MAPRSRRARRKSMPTSSTRMKRNGRSSSRTAASSRSEDAGELFPSPTRGEGKENRSVSGLTWRARLLQRAMRAPLIRSGFGFAALALLAGAPQAVALDAPALPAATADAMAQGASPEAIAEYRRKLREYQAARAAFEQEAGAYWSSISEKRRGRNAKRREHQAIALDDYVLTQPPVYSGPKRPVNPSPEPSEPEQAPRQHKAIPVVADLLKAAAD